MAADHADWPGIAAALTAGSAILFGIGKGIAWLMKHTRSRVTSLEARIDDLEEKYQKLWLAFGFVATGLHARDPNDRSLRQAATILGDAFPLDMATSGDVEAILKKIP
jgi:hypothetical protein